MAQLAAILSRLFQGGGGLPQAGAGAGAGAFGSLLGQGKGNDVTGDPMGRAGRIADAMQSRGFAEPTMGNIGAALTNAFNAVTAPVTTAFGTVVRELTPLGEIAKKPGILGSIVDAVVPAGFKNAGRLNYDADLVAAVRANRMTETQARKVQETRNAQKAAAEQGAGTYGDAGGSRRGQGGRGPDGGRPGNSPGGSSRGQRGE